MTKTLCATDPTEVLLLSSLDRYNKAFRNRKRATVRVFQTGQEHLLNIDRASRLGPLQYLPDFLVTAAGTKLKEDWSFWLECKNSSYPTSLSIKCAALDAYAKIQAFTGVRVYLGTTDKGLQGGNAHGDIFVAPLCAVLALDLPRHHHKWGTNRYGGDDTFGVSPYVVVPRNTFTWPLENLLDQMAEGKKRPFPPSDLTK